MPSQAGPDRDKEPNCGMDSAPPIPHPPSMPLLKRLFLPVLSLASLSPVLAMTEADSTALELSILHPLQWHTPTTDVDGVRLNIFYAKNESLHGVDLSLFGVGHLTGPSKGVMFNILGSITEDDFTGWQTGIVTSSSGSFTGLKGGILNFSEGEMSGWQAGWISLGSGRVEGLQTGLINYAEDMRGVQFGLVNVANQLHGIQIGLGNVNKSGPLVFFPFVNASF